MEASKGVSVLRFKLVHDTTRVPALTYTSRTKPETAGPLPHLPRPPTWLVPARSDTRVGLHILGPHLHAHRHPLHLPVVVLPPGRLAVICVYLGKLREGSKEGAMHVRNQTLYGKLDVWQTFLTNTH